MTLRHLLFFLIFSFPMLFKKKNNVSHWFTLFRQFVLNLLFWNVLLLLSANFACIFLQKFEFRCMQIHPCILKVGQDAQPTVYICGLSAAHQRRQRGDWQTRSASEDTPRQVVSSGWRLNHGAVTMELDIAPRRHRHGPEVRQPCGSPYCFLVC